jgi:hypothetical protein
MEVNNSPSPHAGSRIVYEVVNWGLSSANILLAKKSANSVGVKVEPEFFIVTSFIITIFAKI